MDKAVGKDGGGKTAYWQAMVDEQKNSGLSVRRFCAERGFVLSQFYYWRRRLDPVGAESPLAAADAGKGPAFVELDLGRGAVAREPLSLEIRLDLGGGCTLSIRRG